MFKIVSLAFKSSLCLWCLTSQRKFQAVTVKYLFNAFAAQRWSICKTLSRASEALFVATPIELIISVAFWISYNKFLICPHYD